MHKLLRLTEYGFTVFAMLLYSNAVLLLILSGGASQEDWTSYDTSLYKLSFIAIYLVTCGLLVRQWRHALCILTRSPLILAVVVIAAASVLWSHMLDATIRQSIALIGSSLFGLYLATRYSLKKQLYLLAWTFGIVVILSILFAVLLPKYGVMGGIHAGAWRGVFIHKNGLGARMTNSIIIFSILLFSVRQYRWLAGSGILLSVVLLIFSKSTSALLNTIFILIALVLIQVIRWRYRSKMLAVALLTLAAETIVIVLMTYAEALAKFLGKDLTLTGRTQIWQAVWEMIQEHPWLGYGYDGFWHGLDGPSSYIWLATGWKMTHPHNGFLALWLEIGIIGLALFLVGFLRSLYCSLYLLQTSRDVVYFLPISHFFFLVIANLTESSLLASNFIPWVLYISLSMSLPKEIEQQERRTQLKIKNSNNLQQVSTSTY